MIVLLGKVLPLCPLRFSGAQGLGWHPIFVQGNLGDKSGVHWSVSLNWQRVVVQPDFSHQTGSCRLTGHSYSSKKSGLTVLCNPLAYVNAEAELFEQVT